MDHLPAEMPKEASNHFGSKLFPFVKACLDSKFDTPWEEVKDLPAEIYNAVIAANGRLTPQYEYISRIRAANERMARHEESNSSTGAHQSFCIQMTGHLLDTKAFNNAIDICEEHGLFSRVVNWDIGFNRDTNTSVTIQVIGHLEPEVDGAYDKIVKLCKEENIKLQQAKGPSIDKKIVKMLHQNNNL